MHSDRRTERSALWYHSVTARLMTTRPSDSMESGRSTRVIDTASGWSIADDRLDDVISWDDRGLSVPRPTLKVAFHIVAVERRSPRLIFEESD